MEESTLMPTCTEHMQANATLLGLLSHVLVWEKGQDWLNLLKASFVLHGKHGKMNCTIY